MAKATGKSYSPSPKASTPSFSFILTVERLFWHPFMKDMTYLTPP